MMIGATMLLSAFTINQSVEWQVADGYAIKFKGDDAEGIFKAMAGSISFNENDLASSNFNISVEVSSINTGNGMKNKHAKSDKWFDIKTYPKIYFVSKSFTKTTSGYNVIGTLEMHGTKKEITIPFTFRDNKFTGSFTVNRMDYGVGSMEGMSKKVSNEIRLEIFVPVTKK